MKKFSEFNEQTAINEAVSNFFLALHIDDNLNEIDVNNIVSSIGIKVSKENGILDYLKKFASVSGKMLLAATKGDQETVKKLSDTVSKAEFVDFIMKLDTVTLHLVSAPIHMIAAITGWEISPKLTHDTNHVKDTVVKGVKDAINYIKQKVDSLIVGDKKKEFDDHISSLEKLADPALTAVS